MLTRQEQPLFYKELERNLWSVHSFIHSFNLLAKNYWTHTISRHHSRCWEFSSAQNTPKSLSSLSLLHFHAVGGGVKNGVCFPHME